MGWYPSTPPVPKAVTSAHPGTLLPAVSLVEQTMRQARRSVALALLGAAAVGAALLMERVWSAQALSEAAERHATAHRLAGVIRVAEQQLLLAADAASRTGEPGWVDRFDRLTNQQTQTIEHTVLLAPAEVAERYREATSEVGSLVQRMRASALKAMATGSHDAARGLFEGAAYLKASKALNQANEQLASAMQVATAAELSQLKQRSYLVTGGALMLAMALGLALWRRLTNGLDASRNSLLHAEGRIQRLATSDLLTGMDNRAGLHDAMHQRMHLARSNQERLAVLMVDLDRFKPINDRNGHMVGDLVLKEVALRLSQCLRQSDLRARYGGDEFVVVVDEREGPGGAQQLQPRGAAMLLVPGGAQLRHLPGLARGGERRAFLAQHRVERVRQDRPVGRRRGGRRCWALAQAELSFAPPVLHAIARHGGGGFGVLCAVEQPASVSVGDAVFLS